MENNQTELNKSTVTTKGNEVATTTTQQSSIRIYANDDVDTLIDKIAQSSQYKGLFTVNQKQEDGKTIEVVDRNAIATCLMLGHEIGLKPLQAVSFGKMLNNDAVIKVERGKELGLGPMAALSNIYVWESKGNKLIYTGIHVINALLSKHGIKKELLEDGTEPYVFYTYANGVRLGEVVKGYSEDTKGSYVVINLGLDPTFVQNELKAGKFPILYNKTKRALVKLIRGDQSVAIPYTIQQAIDAGLYAGKKSDGSESKGKDNWNQHPETHLVKMSTILGARFIASDILNNTYLADELPKVESVKETTLDIEETVYTDITVEETN